MIGEVRISLDALAHNARTLRDLIRPAKPAFVVKSNAYGHGAIEAALAVEGFAARICVYSLDEAIALRDGGITAPLLVLGPVPATQLNDVLAARTSITLWDTHEYVHRVAEAARRRNTAFPVHVKINTGATRLGLEPRDAADAIEDYLRLSGLEIEGIFSHLASAEELDSPFTQHQVDCFTRVLEQVEPLLQARGVHPVRHIAASAAAMLWPQTRLDLARIGIALYGLWPSPQTHEALSPNGVTLRPALSYTSTLVVTREIEAGTSVGYGGTYHAPKHMRVGVVPLGYADGIPRLLSNRGAFIVDGVRCPIVGRVCMNMTMLDVSAAPGAHPGSRVTLIGRDGEASVTADDWAGWAETINYEIVTRIPSEVPRLHEDRSASAGNEPVPRSVR
ncbi:MAG: alanine racemase [Vulcanimicrobiaceae bacterium]